MKNLCCFITLSTLFFLLFSCSPREIGQKTQSKAEEGWSYLVEKSKSVYNKSKDTLGLDQDNSPSVSTKMTISKRKFGTLADGRVVNEYRMINENGVEVSVLDYGATVRDIIVPDREGQLGNVSLGFNNLQDYIDKSPYFGCIAGRYANRIKAGKFSIGENSYQLAKNNGPNHLHGGEQGFDKRLWVGKILQNDLGVSFRYRSVDGEEGYPGNLDVTATFFLSEQNELRIEIEAKTDKATVVNLTNHTYFNLAGEGDATILDHQLTLPSTHYVATDNSGIPTGIERVISTPFDFRRSTEIGARIDQEHPQLLAGKGYDHTWLVLPSSDELAPTAILKDPDSGRKLELFTNQPGVQFYTGNYLDGTLQGMSGKSYPHRSGLCLEPQVFPDSPNHQGEDSWQSCILNPGETYSHISVYKFSAN